jgi:hypothetical protein
MKKLYKIIDIDGSVVRIFGYKEEAEKFAKLDRCLRIETIKLIRETKRDNRYTWAYKILGDGII